MFDQNENRNFSEQPEQNPYHAQAQTPVQPQPQPETQAANYVNYYSDPNEQPKKSGSVGRTFLKIVAGLAALAIVSVSSIELYKIFGRDSSGLTAMTDHTNSGVEDTTEPAKQEGTQNSATDSAASWVTMASPKDALSIPDIVEKALPSVVGISAVFEYTEQYNWGFYNYQGQPQQATGTGTGIVLNEEGYIITNAHCIYDSSDTGAGKAVSVSVVMGDKNETEYEAQVVGYDLETDLAVLKIEAHGLTPAEFGDSDTLRVGELVVAIGNPLGFELFGTTTCGIVSALNREVTINEKKMTLIQTDTSINSGNSGGPLLNSYGQVIGINSAKISSSYTSSSASVEGLGFAIPITDAKEIINDLINYGYVTGRPQLGVMGVDVSETDSKRYNMPQGVYVNAVTEGSAAEAAGLRQGDIITKIQGQRILTMDELNEIKNEYDAGDTITLDIYRSGTNMTVDLTLQEVERTEY